MTLAAGPAIAAGTGGASAASIAGLVVGVGMGLAARGGMARPEALPKPTSTPPVEMDVGYASEEERQGRRRRKGYGSTILTGGELGTASTYRKQIFG